MSSPKRTKFNYGPLTDKEVIPETILPHGTASRPLVVDLTGVEFNTPEPPITIDLTAPEPVVSMTVLAIPVPPPGLVECLVIIRTVDRYDHTPLISFEENDVIYFLVHVTEYNDYYPTRYYRGGRRMVKLYEGFYPYNVDRIKGGHYGRLPCFIPLSSKGNKIHNMYILV